MASTQEDPATVQEVIDDRVEKSDEEESPVAEKKLPTSEDVVVRDEQDEEEEEEGIKSIEGQLEGDELMEEKGVPPITDDSEPAVYFDKEVESEAEEDEIIEDDDDMI
ncbi:hypothetical protein K2173_018397 [Erythroxylum novogranatense]|uniref:Uncharacterized protein n=1 Tax=Erythroxylum novogranatense TaxID=1862640 RepID=A0AAV8UE90_9ROSI|nr:hypothetical protein K2173_018397 [Erythroxylum novogranatense]